MTHTDLKVGNKVYSTYMGNAVVKEITDKQVIFSTPDRRQRQYRNIMSNSVTRVSKTNVDILFKKGYLTLI